MSPRDALVLSIEIADDDEPAFCVGFRLRNVSLVWARL